MGQSLRLSSKCEDHFFNSSLNHTSSTFLSLIDNIVKERKKLKFCRNPNHIEILSTVYYAKKGTDFWKNYGYILSVTNRTSLLYSHYIQLISP